MVQLELHLRIDEAWYPVLRVPSPERMSSRPLRWLRYVAACIYGAEGQLSLAPSDEAVPVDYDLEVTPDGVYYFLASGPALFVDPKAASEHTSTASEPPSVHRAVQRTNVKLRDRKCVVSVVQPSDHFLECSHVIPHAKGDEYIERVSEQRSPSQAEKITLINDVRNGLYVSQTVHKALGRYHAVFLRTPNFAMSTRDVPSLVQSTAQRRLTFQILDLDNLPYINLASPHNTDARMPADMSHWPPDFLFDFLYGAVALRQWGVVNSRAKLESLVRPFFYDGDDGDDGDDAGPSMDDDPHTGKGQSKRGHKGEKARSDRDDRARRRAADTRQGGADGAQLDTMDLVLYMWARTNPAAAPPPQETARVDERVQSWVEEQRATIV